MSEHRRYVQIEGETMTCPHCQQEFEDWGVIEDTLHEVPLDSEGYCRDPSIHFNQDCPLCGKIIVWGYDLGTGPYYVRGRSEADVKYLELKGI